MTYLFICLLATVLKLKISNVLTLMCAEHLDSVCFTYCVVVNIVYRYHMVHRSLPIMWRVGYFIQKAARILEGKRLKIANSTG